MNKTMQLIRNSTRYTFQTMGILVAILFILYVLAWLVTAVAHFMGLL